MRGRNVECATGTAPILESAAPDQHPRNSGKTGVARRLHSGPLMRWLILGAAGLVLVGCGGSTKIDFQTGGSAGAGNVGGTGNTGNVGGTGNTGNVGGGGTGGTGNVGGGGMAGTGNVGGGGVGGGTGGATFCCATDLDCPQADQPGFELECINGSCKQVPAPGSCWADKDCGGAACIGGSVCPCEMDCYQGDTLGKCDGAPQCCSKDTDCTTKPNVPLTCVAGNCEQVPPSGQCWTDADCNGGTCGGACICPCGAVCACGGQMGWCTSVIPACCTSSAACGPGAVCANSVCKKSEPPYCWADEECPAGQKCVGANVCPCNALCAIADNPGKCQ